MSTDVGSEHSDRELPNKEMARTFLFFLMMDNHKSSRDILHLSSFVELRNSAYRVLKSKVSVFYRGRESGANPV